MTRFKVLLAVTMLLATFKSFAAKDPDCLDKDKEPTICSYEPNTFGFTKDSNAKKGFLDVNLSLRYEMFPDTVDKYLGRNTYLFLALSTRFGQYLGSDSAPVIGKRFNPKLFARLDRDWGRIDFGYAHESNGQAINSAAEFQAALATPKQAEFARDRISRGWDLLEVEVKHGPKCETEGGLCVYGDVKYFLHNGLFQGRAEEYNDWENDPEGKPRNQVNGLATLIKYVTKGKVWKFDELKSAFKYETGYSHIFKYNTFRFEAGTRILKLPIDVWYQNGYNNNLAYYYKKLSSWGIELEIGSF